MRMIALKSAAAAGKTAAVTIPVRGSAGVDLGGVGRALGLEPSTVRLNGHFVSRGVDLVSKLSWNSLFSFFAARGLPAGGSLLDPIVVQGKPIANTGLKRKVTTKDENPYKRSRMVEGCSKEQNIGNEQLADNKCLCIKRQLKLVDDRPSKKGKIGDIISDCHSSSNKKNAGRLVLKSEDTVEDEKIPRKNRFLESSAIDQSFGTEQEADDNDFLCIKKRLKLDDDQPSKKGKIGACNSGLPNEASKCPLVSTET